MIKNTTIIILLLLVLYLYYQNKKLKGLPNLDNSTSTIYEIQDEEEKEDLIADKDEAVRKKNEAEQEALSLSNKLKLKNQEVTRKDQEIERLKEEKNQVEISLNGKIKELKEKYSKQGQLLDNEQLENNKLQEQIEKLETKITELQTEKIKSIPGSWEETADQVEELTKKHQEQLSQLITQWEKNFPSKKKVLDSLQELINHD